MAQDLEKFAYSFAHGILRVNERQFTDVNNVAVSQDLIEAAVYGTDIRPLKRSVGQMSLGQGQIVFSDLGEAFEFYKALGDSPFMTIFSVTWQLARPPADVRELEALGCRLTKIGVDHSAGADALGLVAPFSFLKLKADGREFALDPKSLLQGLINVGQALTNLL
jgi:hypothetical protein